MSARLAEASSSVEHHGNARQNRLFDPLERLVETRLLLLDFRHGRQHGLWPVKKL
jgi:hypothetical protein